MFENDRGCGDRIRTCDLEVMRQLFSTAKTPVFLGDFEILTTKSSVAILRIKLQFSSVVFDGSILVLMRKSVVPFGFHRIDVRFGAHDEQIYIS